MIAMMENSMAGLVIFRRDTSGYLILLFQRSHDTSTGHVIPNLLELDCPDFFPMNFSAKVFSIFFANL